MHNLDDNDGSSVQVYMDSAMLIIASHSAKKHKKTIEKPIRNFTYLPGLLTSYCLQSIIPPHHVWNQLLISFSGLDANTTIEILNVFLTNPIVGHYAFNTKCYTHLQLVGPEKKLQHCWQPVSAQELFLWLAIPIHMGLI